MPNPNYMLPRETCFSSPHEYAQSEEMEEDILCKWKSKTAKVAILMSDKTACKPKTVTGDKKGCYTLINGQ